MKFAKTLLALLLALALITALAVPAFAAGVEGPTLWQKVQLKLAELWLWVLKLFGYRPPEIILYKPVIYLYPEQPMGVGVSLQTRGAHLVESIPAYGDGWRVLAQPGGTLTDLAGGGDYPYLFWEAALDTPWPRPTEGFVVARDDLAGFLNEKLHYLGLNDAEADEFIGFWLPQLAVNEYTLIHFAGEDYAERFPLEITPAPDSLLRVFMVARAAKAGQRAVPQALVPFERSGFAVIEWGGMIL